jgi:transposase
MKNTKRQFTPEFKAEAVKLWETSGRKGKAIGEQLGIRPSLFTKWKHALEHPKTPPARRLSTQAQGAFSDAGPAATAEIARLRRENERLKMEHEILKKTVAFISEITK